jgi:putative acetyltransferase
MSPTLLVDVERSTDAPSLRAVHLAAFPTPIEADLVDRLRANGRAIVSLVAREADAVVGHVLFSPVTIHETGHNSADILARGLGLAPLAVLPAYQRRGIGTALIHAGIAACLKRAVPFIVVLGAPAYYGRFGFEPASRHRLASEYDAGDAFQVLLVKPDSLPSPGGLVRYAEEFAGLD